MDSLLIERVLDILYELETERLRAMTDPMCPLDYGAKLDNAITGLEILLGTHSQPEV